MTSIELLSISNIRSFGPSGADNLIHFYKPLTIIVGHNGAGKTTIIECLKYVTTGDFPPNCNSGQAFIHDPKIAGVKEVKAQIRLKFKNVKGEPVIVTRTLQVTQKMNNKLEFKTLEGNIQINDRSGNRVSQSHRCADLDLFIPQFMGVSSAILNSVIFCHQEESNWPLGEPKLLKKKLDDIFCSTRYNKALEEIKKQMKNLQTQSKENSLKLETIKTKKSQFEKICAKIDSYNEIITNSDSELALLSNELQKINELMAKNAKIEDEARAMMSKIKELKSKRDYLIKKNSEFLANLQEEYLESDEEIIRVKNSFDATIQSLTENNYSLSQKLEKLKAERSHIEGKLREKITRVSTIEVNLQNVQKLAQQRDQEIINFITKYRNELENVTTNNHLLNSRSFTRDQIKEFQRIAKQLTENASNDLLNYRNSSQEKRNQFSKSLGSLKAEISSIQTSITNIEQQKNSNTREIQNIAKEIQRNHHLISQMNDLESKLKLEESELVDTKNKIETLQFDQRIHHLNLQKEEIEKKLKVTSERLSIFHKMSAIKSKYDAKKEDRVNKQNMYQQQLKEVLKSTNEHFLECFHSGDPNELKNYLLQKFNQTKESLSATEKSLQEHLNRSSILNHNLSINTKNLTSSQKNYQSLIEKVNEKRYGEQQQDLPAQITTIEKIIQTKQKNFTMTKSAELIYKNFIKESKENHECPLCERAFQENTNQLQEFIKKLQEILVQVPQNLENNQRELRDAEMKLNELNQVLPFWNEANRINATEIPKLESDIEKFNVELNSLKLPIDDAKKRLQNLKEEEKKIQLLLSTLDPCIYHFKEYLLLQKEEKDLESTLPNMSCDDDDDDDDNTKNQSIDQLNNEYSNLQVEHQNIQKELKEVHDLSRSSQSKVNKLLNSINQLKGSLLNATTSSATVERLRKKSSELNEELLHFDQRIDEFQSSLQLKRTEHDTLQTQATQFQKECDRTEKTLQSTLDQIRSNYLMIESILLQLMNNNNNNNNNDNNNDNFEEVLRNQLTHLLNEKNEVENRCEVIKEQIKNTENEVFQIQNKLSLSTMAKRNIDDNLIYRETRREIQHLTDELTKIESSAEVMISNPRAVIDEKNRLLKEFQTIKSKIDQLEGSRKTYLEENKKNKRELANSAYQNIDDQFREMSIKVNTLTMARDDLDRYYVALDKALMKYHTMKIDEINKILKELWQTTYQGQDIDTVEIRADCESKTRSFNYRVCMIKGDTELEMRGRCSAGQKVLTSLIVRLALAETLGVNCGIIALDEPTTNLDRANVESFAKALVNLIETRRRQSNFQLIVITHDEEFVQLLGRSEQADYYWRVSKDSDNNSIVTRCEIADLA